MSSARFVVGDVFDVLATLPDGSVDLVLTSPPFLALRSYLPADHPDKGKEIGSEPDPATFIDTMLELTAEWGRVLTPHGSICVELGDTYSGADEKSWPLAKSLCMIPELYRVALAYGVNPLTGAESPAGRWRVRNNVTWCRPNPPVGALGDKYRPATSDMVIACRSIKRWFDLDAVRTPLKPHTAKYAGQRGGGAKKGNPDRGDAGIISGIDNPDGAPPLDWWNIPTHGYPGAHYATWPPKLCEIPIDSMCPREVCADCGEPRRRITGEPTYVQTRTGGTPSTLDYRDGTPVGGGVRSPTNTQGASSVTRQAETLGWSDCGHDSYRPGVVLDPFAGSGTTLAVATGHGRHAIGIDLDGRNAVLAEQRVGMFLTVEHHTKATP